MLKFIIVRAFALFMAVLMAEIFIRMIYKEELVFSSWYSKGIHTPDENLGFRLTPHYKGSMSHADHVWGVPLELDKYGYRKEANNKVQGKQKKILILGGASMMFSYGLPDSKTVHHRLAYHSQNNVVVKNCSCAGAPLFHTWKTYHKYLDPYYTPDIVVVCVFSENLKKFNSIPSDIYMTEKYTYDQNIHFVGNCLRVPLGRIEEMFGEPLFKSHILYSLLQQRHGLNKMIGEIKLGKPKYKPREPYRNVTLHNFLQLANKLKAHFEKKGSEFIFVFLPIQRLNIKTIKMLNLPDTELNTREIYTNFFNTLPSTMTKYDLNKMLYEKIQYTSFQGNNHYGRDTADLIGLTLADLVDKKIDFIKK